MAEDHGGLVAASAFHVHEVGVGGGHQSFHFVLLLLGLKGGVKEVSVHAILKKIRKYFIIHRWYIIQPSNNSLTNACQQP